MFQQRHKTQLNQNFQKIILMMQMRHFQNHFWNTEHKIVPKDICTTEFLIMEYGLGYLAFPKEEKSL